MKQFGNAGPDARHHALMTVAKIGACRILAKDIAVMAGMATVPNGYSRFRVIDHLDWRRLTNSPVAAAPLAWPR